MTDYVASPTFLSRARVVSAIRSVCFGWMLLLFLGRGAAAQIPVPARDLDENPAVYTLGTICPEEGTIEVTSVPTRPGSEFQNAWYFAFRITPGRPIPGNSLLGLFTPSGERGERGLSGVARSQDGRERRTSYARSERLDFFSPQVPVHLALSWGPEGLLLYVNGTEVGRGDFSGTLDPMPGWFEFVTDSAFNIRAAKISTRQLRPDELTADPSKSFEKTANTSFLWHRGKSAEYVETAFARSRSDLLPLWTMDEAMTPAGEPAELLLAGANGMELPAGYRIRIITRDFEGNATGSSDTPVSLAARQTLATWRLPLPGVGLPGFYTLEIRIEAPDGTTTVWNRNHMTYPARDPNVADGKWAEYMGHHLIEKPEILARLGIRWIRDWGNGLGFQWYGLEPQKGVFHWDDSDRAVASAKASGIRILGLLGNPPGWAAVEPDAEHKSKHPLAHMSGRWKPRSLREWGDYVYQTVLRYKDTVKHWEIYNEVDYHPPASVGSFSGSTEEYFQLLQTAWKAAKAADPECKILISGFSTNSSADQQMPYDLLDMGAAKFCDIFNMHSYQGLIGVSRLKSAVAAVAPDMPFWQTEQMWHTITDARKRCELTAAIQFWFIEEAFEKYFNFGDDFFANRFTRSPEAVLQTLAVAQSHLRKCEEYLGLLTDLPVRDFDLKHSFRRTDGFHLTALGQLGEEVRFHLAGKIIRAEDIFGRELSITPNGDLSVLPPVSIAFVISEAPLRVVRAERRPRKLCMNPGFEEVSGDITMGGLESAVIHNWEMRAEGGDIRLDPDARTGNYALKITATGKGRVHAFFDTMQLPAGKYELSAWIKSASGRPGSAFFSMHDRTSRRFEQTKLEGISPNEYVRHSVEFDLQKAEGSVIFSVGTGANNETGSVLFDDITMIRVPLFRPEAMKVFQGNSPAGLRVVRNRDKEIDWGPMLKALGDSTTIQGMEVGISPAPVI
ncbi:MAG: endo-1,4-beta-xylanase, partial [Kiritimatiellia bacterium]|nr:endo-1,4-beta-xylanase [Kiritimatiellia bacterium]